MKFSYTNKLLYFMTNNSFLVQFFTVFRELSLFLFYEISILFVIADKIVFNLILKQNSGFAYLEKGVPDGPGRIKFRPQLLD